MSPPGIKPPRVPGSAATDRTIEIDYELVARAESPRPVQDSSAEFTAEAPAIPPQNGASRKLITFFNPNARDGRIGKELPYFQRTMERAGWTVVPVETLPEEKPRQERIYNAMLSHLPEPSAEPTRLVITPYGGDGTIWETAGQVVPAAGVSLAPGVADPDLASARIRSLMTFFLPKKGTAMDNAVQTGSPRRIPAMPRFIDRAVELPFWFPTVEVRERPGHYVAAGHNFGIGESGFMFERRAANYRAKPKAWYNRGLLSYLRLLPNAVFNRYGLLGFDVVLRQYDAQGNLMQEATRRGSEVIVTPNRIMAGVGGVPGAWGETKIIVLPHGPRGVLAIGEYIFRGLATKIGFNRVGPASRLRTLSMERQWLVKTGERVDVEIRVPDTFGWDVLRMARQRQVSFRGLFDLRPEIPAAGELLALPAQLNGDVAPYSNGYTVRSPGIAIPMLAHPNSLAVRLARASALVNGGTPLISDQQVTSNVPGYLPSVQEDTPDTLRVRTAFISQPRLMNLLRHYRVRYQYGLELLTAMQGVTDSEHLNHLSSRDVTIENARSYLESAQGKAWIRARYGDANAARTRLLEGGVPLVLGIATMLGAERLADHWGISASRDRELRFGMVTYLSHAVTSNAAPVWEVITNRILQRPYDFVRLRQVRAAGEVLTQYTFSSNQSWLRAIGNSWRSGALGMEAGLEMGFWRRIGGIGAIPLRAAWNMGEGMIFSRLTEQALRGLPEDSAFRHYAPTVAFFTPDVMRLVAPGSATRLFSSRSMRFASRAFATGFIADMTYTGLQRLAFRENTNYEQSVNHRAAERRRERRGISWFSWRTIPRVLAPSLSDHIDSHSWLIGGESEEIRNIRSEDQEMSSVLQRSIRGEIPMLLNELGGNARELFGSEIVLTDQESMMQEQLAACRGNGRLPRDAGFDDTAAYLRREFRAVIPNLAVARRHLARIEARRIQQDLAGLRSVEIGYNSSIRSMFDTRGILRSESAEDFESWIGA